ncbi:MAG TPA: ATP-dependent Clp protease ATP-binding subunit [Candidatus Sulfotelmatobacter sp.]|nr:ATP-dependent Clp protease ATP-binding subunit [Candidatus Sulfotelmatobacter sp.]
MNINLNSPRAKDARIAKRIGPTGYRAFLFTGSVLVVAAIALMFIAHHIGFILLGLGLAALMPALWYKNYLRDLPPSDNTLDGRLSANILGSLKPKQPLTAENIWSSIAGHWQTLFILNHLLITNDLVKPMIAAETDADLDKAFAQASAIADQYALGSIDIGLVAIGLLQASPQVGQLLTSMKSSPDDLNSVGNWFARKLAEEKNSGKQSYGGIGRDWAFGFTPLLNQYGLNISLAMASSGASFNWLSDSEGVRAMESSILNDNQAIALVGEAGVGKTSAVYGLAQRLISGKTSKELAYHQLVVVSATDLVSATSNSGNLEHLMVSLVNEASHAGHIILFLDDAELFFSNKLGAFDASQILQSIIRKVPIILALTPNDFQRLQSSSPSLANLLTPVMLKEPDQNAVMRILEDTAISLENKHKVLISYGALKAAYSLSDRYVTNKAYPGKAITLLEQSLSHAADGLITADSVGQAIESTKGVKVAGATPAEADELLNLEDKIHERMINQTHAVSVVANSLRRARAGVANPNRPIGSFLFLGPTGVGKTELAKSLAAVYFHSETNMVRLDMSEYQNPGDADRLLSSDESGSLVLSVRNQPFSVVLLDEIEKSHPNILNLLLQLLDEGKLTDTSGQAVSFKDCIIIATSNAGAQSIRERVEKGEELPSFADELIEELIKSNQFKPELINRFDEIVLFRPLKPEELDQIVVIMMKEVNQTLFNQNIKVELSEAAIKKIVQAGYDPRLGARPMRRMLQKSVEDIVAKKILKNEAKAGDTINLDADDLSF